MGDSLKRAAAAAAVGLVRDGMLLGLGTGSTTDHALELLGERAARGLRDLVSVPVLGSIAAGEPLSIPPSDSWRTDELEKLDLPTFLTQGKDDVFALRVKGESMIDALVADGDLVFMEPVDQPQSPSR